MIKNERGGEACLHGKLALFPLLHFWTKPWADISSSVPHRSMGVIMHQMCQRGVRWSIHQISIKTNLSLCMSDLFVLLISSMELLLVIDERTNRPCGYWPRHTMHRAEWDGGVGVIKVILTCTHIQFSCRKLVTWVRDWWPPWGVI